MLYHWLSRQVARKPVHHECFPADDELFKLVEQASATMHRLSIHVHYASCEKVKRNRRDSTRHSDPAAMGRSHYWSPLVAVIFFRSPVSHAPPAQRAGAINQRFDGFGRCAGCLEIYSDSSNRLSGLRSADDPVAFLAAVDRRLITVRHCEPLSRIDARSCRKWPRSTRNGLASLARSSAATVAGLLVPWASLRNAKWQLM